MTRDFTAELKAARDAEDWSAHERIWEERRHADVSRDEAALMTEGQAKRLASWDVDYYARKIRGQWCVWSYSSDHVVEFSQRDIDDMPL
jgi:hypothetical protein